jgi:thioredoxin-like negative regulator of GroEL
MPALQKLRRAANDFREKVKSPIASPAPVMPIITLAQKHHTLFRGIVIGLLVVIVAMTSSIIGFMQGTRRVAVVAPAETAVPPAPAKIIVKLEREGSKNIKVPLVEIPNAPVPLTKADANIDIVLPAESLTPPSTTDADSIAPAPDSSPAIGVVSQQINDLPALHEVAHEGHKGHAVMLHPGPTLTEDQLLNNAHLLLESGDDAAALDFYNRILAFDKTSRPALEGKMYALQKTGDYEGAVDVGHLLLKIEPEDVALRANLIAALGQSAAPASLTELKHMVEVTPNDAPTHVALARLLIRRGYYEQAAKELQRATQIAPNNLGYRLDIAILYDKAGHAADAVTLYQQVMRAAADQEEDGHLPLSTTAIRQRIAYLNASITSPQ